MIYYDYEYKISTTKVKYKEFHEGTVEKFIVEPKSYWENLNKIKVIELLGFEEVDDYTEEQKNRLDIVNKLKIPGGVSLVENYILTGTFSQKVGNEEEGEVVLEVGPEHPLFIIKFIGENQNAHTEMTQAQSVVTMETLLTVETKAQEASVMSAMAIMELGKSITQLQDEIDKLKGGDK